MLLAPEILDERLRMDLLVDVYRDAQRLQVGQILGVLPAPHELWVRCSIPTAAPPRELDRRRRLVVLADEPTQLIRGDVRSLVAMRQGIDRLVRSVSRHQATTSTDQSSDSRIVASA